MAQHARMARATAPHSKATATLRKNISFSRATGVDGFASFEPLLLMRRPKDPEKNKIIAKVPSGAKTGLITVTTSDGTGESKKNFIVPPEFANWTFMVYLDADNNLESAGIDDFLEMAAVGTSPNVNIVVQMDRTSGSEKGGGDKRSFEN